MELAIDTATRDRLLRARELGEREVRPVGLEADRLSRPMGWLSAGAAAGMVAFGAFIFYNTNILNHYQTAHDQLERQANYEKKYKGLAADPQPKVTAVKLAVDLFPREEQVRARGTYTLVNKSGKPVDTIHVLFFQGELVTVSKLVFEAAAGPLTTSI